MSNCLVENWFWSFIRKHIARSGRGDFPPVTNENGVEFFSNWRSAFIRHGLTEDDANQASSIVCERDLFPGMHLQAILDAARDLRRLAEMPNADRDIDSARKASWGCKHCGGNGWATFPVHLIYGEPLPPRLERHGNSRAALFCVCPLGRFFKSRNDSASPDKQAKAGSLDDFRHLLADAGQAPFEADVIEEDSPF